MLTTGAKGQARLLELPNTHPQALSLGFRPADSKGDHSGWEREHRDIWDQHIS